MIFNIVMIVIISLAIATALFLFFHAHQSAKFELPKDYGELKDYVREEIEKSSTMMVTNMGLSLENREKQLRQREDIRNYIRKSCSGDRGSRQATLQLVKDKIQNIVNEDNIEQFMLFSPDTAWSSTIFEACLLIFDTNTTKRLKGEAGVLGLADDGFWNMIEQYGIRETFSLDKLKEIYTENYNMLEYADKKYILTQMLFADLYGLGVIDTLNYQTRGIEEIQIGLRGPQSRAYDYRKAFVETIANSRCAKDTIDVIYRGKPILLDFLGFRNDAEMQRVITNLIVNCNAGELTEKHPKIVADTIDGRRVAAARPPQTDAWLALIRKFNLSDIILENLYKDKKLVDALRWIVKSGANIAVTGEMETGKTTLLRSLVAITNPKYAIRIVENDSFELNGRYYFPDRNVTSMKVNQVFNEEDVLAFARRTSGQVFTIGEVNQLSMANLACKLAKIATQLLFSAHYTTTANMVADLKNAKIANGFTNVRLAEIEAVESLNFDVHIVSKNGCRYIASINEVVLTEKGFDVNCIVSGELIETPDDEKERYKAVYTIKNRPTEHISEKAKRNLSDSEYKSYEEFWGSTVDVNEPEWLKD